MDTERILSVLYEVLARLNALGRKLDALAQREGNDG